MDSKQAGWGAVISGLVVVGAAAGLIIVGTADSGDAGEGAEGPHTSEMEQEYPLLPMPSGGEEEEGEIGLTPKDMEMPGDNREPGEKGAPRDADSADDGDKPGSGGAAFGPGKPPIPQLPQLDGVGPAMGEN